MHRHLQITLALLILAILPSRAATYYVRTDGNDANTGTANTSGGAWRTVQKAANTTVAGDTVNIVNGTYAENVTESTVANSGNPITFTGSSGVNIRGFVISGQYITLNGVTIGTAGLRLTGNNNTVSGVFINLQSTRGVVGLDIQGSTNTVTGCDITGVFVETGIVTGSSSTGNLIKDSLIHDLVDCDGLRIWGNGNIFRNLEITGSTNPGYTSNGWHTDCFQIFGDGGSTSINNVIENCYFHDNDGQLGNLEKTSNNNIHDLIVRNNVFKNIQNACFCGMKTLWYNNVFDNSGSFAGYSIRLQQDASVNNPTGSEVRNNAFITNELAFSGTSPGSFTITNNYLGSTTFAGIGTPTGTGGVAGGNPQWVNRSAANYQIANSSSVLINAGANLSTAFTTDRAGVTRPSSGAWEIGPYEFGATPDITPPTVSSATINPAGNQITLVFSENVQFGAGGSSGWSTSMTGGASAMTYASGSGTASITFNLGRVVNAGESGTLSYTQPGNGWQDTATPPNAMGTFPPPVFNVVNNSTQGPPALSSATINSAGNQLVLVFSQTVQAGTGGNGGWTLNVSPSAGLGTVTGVGSNTLTYNITRVINVGESISLSYAQPGNGIESVASGADVASIPNRAVTNNSTQGQTSVPQITLPAGPYFGTQTTTITDADSGAGAVIHYSVDGSTPTASSPVYSAPLPIATNQTIKAIATWSGHANSAIASSDYEVVSWVSTGSTFKTFAVPQKTGTFTWSFSILAPAAGSDCVVGIGPGPVSAYTGMACIVQFLNNTINAINGGSYTAGPAYSPGVLYNFVATINLTAHIWTLTSTPASGGTTTTIVNGAAFRTEQAAASQLSSIGIEATSGVTTTSLMSFPSGASSARYIGLRGVPASGGAVP